MKSRNSLEIQKSLEKSTLKVQKSALKSRNSLEIQKSLEKSTLKSRNPLWNPEIHFEIQKIHFEIQKSTLKSRNPLWNPEIQKSILKSEIHLKSSGFRNLVRRDAPWRTPRCTRMHMHTHSHTHHTGHPSCRLSNWTWTNFSRRSCLMYHTTMTPFPNSPPTAHRRKMSPSPG